MLQESVVSFGATSKLEIMSEPFWVFFGEIL